VPTNQSSPWLAGRQRARPILGQFDLEPMSPRDGPPLDENAPDLLGLYALKLSELLGTSGYMYLL
jgi:hypothetical protein